MHIYGKAWGIEEDIQEGQTVCHSEICSSLVLLQQWQQQQGSRNPGNQAD